MYALVRTSEYSRDVREIEGHSGFLEQELERGVYLELRRAPYEGNYLSSAGLWITRQRAALGLLLVQIYYRIDEERREVELVAARQVPLNIL